MKKTLLWLWQLPQHLLALLLLLLLKLDRRKKHKSIKYKGKIFIPMLFSKFTSIILGDYIFHPNNKVIRREAFFKKKLYEESKDSIKYGPLYILLKLFRVLSTSY